MALHHYSFWEILRGDYEGHKDEEYAIYYKKNEYSKEIDIVFKNMTIDLEQGWNEEYIDLKYSLHFEKCKLIDFDFNNVLSEKDIMFNNCEFLGLTSFKKNILGSLKIYDSKFEKGVTFKGEYSNISILGTEAAKEINTISFLEGICDRLNIDSNNSNINKISIGGVKTLIDKLEISGNNISQLDLLDTQINDIKLSGKYGIDSKISISNIKVNKISIDELHNKGDLSFNNIYVSKGLKPSKIKINSFLEERNLIDNKDIYGSLSNIDKQKFIRYLPISSESEYYIEYKDSLYERKESDNNTIFKMSVSRLGSTQFKNFALKDFEKIEIIDTDLSTIKTFNSTFPINKITGNSKSLYEVFNDLYTVAKNKNDKREQTEYYRASKSHLFKSLTYKKNFPSKVSLLVSKLYSDFGMNWLQGVGITVLIAIFFFSLMLLLSNYNIELSKNGLNHLCKNVIPYFIQYLNPVHRIDFMDKTGYPYSTNTCFVFFDFVGRICISIGIFEIVLSFRKFVRS